MCLYNIAFSLSIFYWGSEHFVNKSLSIQLYYIYDSIPYIWNCSSERGLDCLVKLTYACVELSGLDRAASASSTTSDGSSWYFPLIISVKLLGHARDWGGAFFSGNDWYICLNFTWEAQLSSLINIIVAWLR